MFNKILHSERSVAANKTNCFEGWYFKCDDGEGNIFSFIVGISRNKNSGHSFVQFIDCDKTHYFSFPIKAFFFNNDDMTINVGGNLFSMSGIKCNIKMQGVQINADLKFGFAAKFKKSVYCPSAMGPFSYLPLSCNHTVISMNHTVSGTLKIGNETKAIENGFGYIEKDFGKNFPKNYFWAQGQNKEISVMFAYAYPLVFGIKGFLCIVNIKGKQHNLSLYTGAKLYIKSLSKSFADVVIKRGKISLSLQVSGDAENFKTLFSPSVNGNMNAMIKESVCAKLIVNFKKEELEKKFELNGAYEHNIK